MSAGERTAAANPYTGQAGTQSRGTSVNTRTGQVTQHAGAAGAGPEGAAGAGAFRSSGSQGDVKGAGGFHYNADTGSLGHGGVANVNGNLYAGHDGNVYQHGDGGWSQVGGGRSGDFSNQMGGLDNDRFASERGDQRISGNFGGDRFGGGGFGGGGFGRGVGGFRGGLGGFGGGFRGGGFRR